MNVTAWKNDVTVNVTVNVVNVNVKNVTAPMVVPATYTTLQIHAMVVGLICRHENFKKKFGKSVSYR